MQYRNLIPLFGSINMLNKSSAIFKKIWDVFIVLSWFFIVWFAAGGWSVLLYGLASN